MDYRVRWQQRRRQRQQKRLLAIPAALVLALLIYLLMRLLTGPGDKHWVYQELWQTTPRFTVGPAAVYSVWPSGHMVALRIREGTSLTSGPFFSAPEAFNAPPLLADHVLYFGSDLGILRALDARSGQPLWDFDSTSPIRCRPVYENGRLYFGNDAGKVYAFARGGTKLWAAQLDGSISGEGAFAGNAVVFSTTRGTVYALNRSTGAPVWQTQLGAPVFSPVTAALPLLIVGTDFGDAFVLDASGGKVVHRYRTAGLVRQPAAVTDKLIVFGSTDGWLRAISRDGQQPVWAHYLQGPATAGPVAAEGLIYAASPERLVCLREDTGRVRRAWKGEQFSGDLAVTVDAIYVGTTVGSIIALVAP